MGMATKSNYTLSMNSDEILLSHQTVRAVTLALLVISTPFTICLNIVVLVACKR